MSSSDHHLNLGIPNVKAMKRRHVKKKKMLWHPGGDKYRCKNSEGNLLDPTGEVFKINNKTTYD
jgi:hypothetical protein